jgi:hypothetical protein
MEVDDALCRVRSATGGNQRQAARYAVGAQNAFAADFHSRRRCAMSWGPQRHPVTPEPQPEELPRRPADDRGCTSLGGTVDATLLMREGA